MNQLQLRTAPVQHALTASLLLAMEIVRKILLVETSSIGQHVLLAMPVTPIPERVLIVCPIRLVPMVQPIVPLGRPVRLVNTITRRQPPHVTVNVCLAL
jgi:hypothetical protein